MQCNPVVVDAKHISAKHKARYFWGNLPGMNRPVSPLPSDRLNLKDSQNPDFIRVAELTKLQTPTAKISTIKPARETVCPIAGQESRDVIWHMEMERFGVD